MRVLVKTWICSNENSGCPFKWQFEGEAVDSSPYDLTPAELKAQFPERQFDGLMAGKCPNCYMQGRSGALGLAVDDAQMSKVTVSEDAEIEQLRKPNNSRRVKIGERQRVGVVNGQPAVVTEDILGPEQEPLTTTEVNNLKEQAQRNRDRLTNIAVKEVSK